MARVLIIEDREEAGQALVRMLQNAGHEGVLCLSVAQALQAIQVLQPSGPDLVIVGPVEAASGGLDVIAELRTLYPRLPLVLGAPFSGAELLEAVAALLDQGSQAPGPEPNGEPNA